jgi:hypothetical protein
MCSRMGELDMDLLCCNIICDLHDVSDFIVISYYLRDDDIVNCFC